MEVHGDFAQLKQWEKRSYKAYKIEEISTKITSSKKNEWKDIIRKHISEGRPSEFGASCIDICLVEYVSENYGSGKANFFKYIKDNSISDKDNSAMAICQVGRGDRAYLDILENDGRVKDWEFIREWVGEVE